MLTSKKKNSKKFLGFFLGLSCLLVLTSCKKETAAVEKIEPTSVAEVINIDQKLLNVKDITINDTKLYRLTDNKLVEVGTVIKGVNLDMSDLVNSNKINIKDTNLYVDANDLQVSDRWYEKRNHLIPFNTNLKTNSTYTLYDVKGNALMKIDSVDEYMVYVLKGEDNKYGVSFQNEILYIDASDVSNVYDNKNTDEAYASNLAVLMYHFFYDESQGETRRDVNFVEVKEFKEQLESMKNEGYQTLTMRETLLFMENRANIPAKSVAITIDDGDPTVFKYAYPLLKEYKMNATLFLITGQEEPTLNYDYITMREDGLELQSHSWQMHQGGCAGQGHGGRLLCTDFETGVNDTRMSFDYVDGGFVYCYPFGDFNDNAKAIIKEGGAKLAFTTQFGKINQGMDLLELPRVRVTGGNPITSFMKNIK